MVSWSTMEHSSFQKFSHFVIGNEAPYLTKLPLFSGKVPSKLKTICILCLVLIDLFQIEPKHLLQVLHCQADVTKPRGAATPHQETSNFVGIIGYPGFGDEHHSSININYPGLPLKASMFRSSSLPDSSPSSFLSAILNLVRMARRRNRSVPIHS